MTITIEAFTGSKTSLSSTEWSMTAGTSGPVADTTAGVFAAMIDLSALAAGDTFRFAVYSKCRTGDTQRLLYTAELSGVQPYPNWASPSLLLGVGWDMTLKKIAGTDRTINWRISRVS